MKVNAYSIKNLHKLYFSSTLEGLYCQFIPCDITEIRDWKYLLRYLPLFSLQHRILFSSLFTNALFTEISNSSSSRTIHWNIRREYYTLQHLQHVGCFLGMFFLNSTQRWFSPHLISLLLLRPPLDFKMNPFLLLESYKCF